MKTSPLTPPFNVNPDGSFSYRTELVIAQERVQELLARVARLEADALEVLEFLQKNYDTIDGDDGEPGPNREMQLGTMIQCTLYGEGNF